MVGDCFGVLLGLHVGMLVLGDRLDRVLLIRELDPIGPLIVSLTSDVTWEGTYWNDHRSSRKIHHPESDIHLQKRRSWGIADNVIQGRRMRIANRQLSLLLNDRCDV